MDDASTTVTTLKAAVLAFSRDRDWEQFHHPKDLGVALACEVGELLEHFRYRTDTQVRDVLNRAADHQAIAHELADCLWLILRLADVCHIDLASALESKLIEAAAKYPADLVRGKPDKYTAYQKEADPQ
jgi:dCTP diphosphatase